MVSNIVHYALMMQGKLHPIRKSDLIKIAMNNQSKDYREVIDTVADELRDVFGIILVGMKNVGPVDDSVEECEIWDATSFILISKYRQQVTTLMADLCGNAIGAKALSKDFATAALMLILSTTYMMDRSITEDSIWELLENMEMAYQLCKKREELRRFLKNVREFVDTLYLSKYEEKTADQLIVRYNWGFRAEMEISKFAMLKHVAENILGKCVTDFPLQLSKISRHERETIDEQDESDNDSCPDTSFDEGVNDNGTGGGQSPPKSRKDNKSGRRAVIESDSDEETQAIGEDNSTDSD